MDTILPPNYKHIIELEFIRQFTFLERLKLACGFSVICRVNVFTEHKTGKFAPNIVLIVTKELPQPEFNPNRNLVNLSGDYDPSKPQAQEGL